MVKRHRIRSQRARLGRLLSIPIASNALSPTLLTLAFVVCAPGVRLQPDRTRQNLTAAEIAIRASRLVAAAKSLRTTAWEVQWVPPPDHPLSASLADRVTERFERTPPHNAWTWEVNYLYGHPERPQSVEKIDRWGASIAWTHALKGTSWKCGSLKAATATAHHLKVLIEGAAAGLTFAAPRARWSSVKGPSGGGPQTLTVRGDLKVKLSGRWVTTVYTLAVDQTDGRPVALNYTSRTTDSRNQKIVSRVRSTFSDYNQPFAVSHPPACR